MKYPTEITIRSYTYQIEYLKTRREVDRNFESDEYLGTCDSDIMRIFVACSQISILDTLIHEILHAIFTRNKMLKMALQPDMEESFITTLASEIASILLDNELIKLPARGPSITTRIVPEKA